MNRWGIHRVILPICALVLAFAGVSGAAQTPESDGRFSEGSRTSVPATQRDIVTASNADALLLGDEYPRADVVFTSGDLTCYRLMESRDHERSKTVTLDLTWCLSARNGLVTAASKAWAFSDDIFIQGAFCGWDSLPDEMQTDTIICKVLIQEVRCGPLKSSCINEELNWALHGDGRWEQMDEWNIQPYAYDASRAYPLSG